MTIAQDDVQVYIEKMNKLIGEAVDAELANQTDGITSHDITHLVIGGGGSALPMIADGLLQILPIARKVDIALEYTVSLVQRGAAIYAADPSKIKEPRSNYTFGLIVLGTEVPTYPHPRYTDINGIRYYFTYKKLIIRGEIVQDVVYECWPPNDGKGMVSFTVLQGEADNPEDCPPNEIIGTANLELPAGFTYFGPQVKPLQFTLRVGLNGIVTSQGRGPDGKFR